MFADVRPSQFLHIGVQCNLRFLHLQAFPQGPLHPHDTSMSKLSGVTGLICCNKDHQVVLISPTITWDLTDSLSTKTARYVLNEHCLAAAQVADIDSNLNNEVKEDL